MKQRVRPKYKITFTNKGFLIVDSYDQTEGGVYWSNGSIRGYSTNDLVKNIEEVTNG
jgi:hypothetical protein